MGTDELIFRKVLRETDSGIGAELYLYKNSKEKYYMMFLDNLLSKGKKSKILLKEDLESGKFLELMVRNPELVNMLILKDDANKLRGRALVWNLTEPSGRIFMDRIYVSKDSIENIFVKYARDHNMVYRTSAADNYFKVFVPKGDGKYEKKCNTKFRMSVKLKTKGVKHYPFMDNLIIKNKNEPFNNKLG